MGKAATGEYYNKKIAKLNSTSVKKCKKLPT